MNIIVRSGEAITFDSNKLIEAISNALIITAKRVAEITDSILEEMERSFLTALHSFAHWMMRYCSKSKGTAQYTAVCFLPTNIFLLKSPILCTNILARVSAILYRKARTTYLLRHRDRDSSTHNSHSNYETDSIDR